MYATSFLRPEEQALGERFLSEGYVLAPVEDRAALDAIRDLLVQTACGVLRAPPPADAGQFLEQIGARVSPTQLNDVRLALIGALAETPWVRPAYFSLARRALETLVGNELCMQRRVNLSIQLPEDKSSLLPVHGDVWSGDSPFEVVLWVPWVNCHDTKSMYLLAPEPATRLTADLGQYADSEALFRAIEPEVQFMRVNYGEFLLFNQNLPHGNVVNRDPAARWSSNCRFKGVFTPYADKRLGEFFEPITLRAATRVGMDYEYPTGCER